MNMSRPEPTELSKPTGVPVPLRIQVMQLGVWERLWEKSLKYSEMPEKMCFLMH